LRQFEDKPVSVKVLSCSAQQIISFWSWGQCQRVDMYSTWSEAANELTA